MKEIKELSIYERLYITSLVRGLKGSTEDLESGLKILKKITISEEEAKEIELESSNNHFQWDKDKSKSLDVKLEDKDYQYLLTVFTKKDQDASWEMNELLLDMIKKVREAKTCD